MTNFDDVIEAIFALFIVFLFGYVFFIVLSALSPGFAVLFALALVIVVIAILLRLFRG